MTDARTPREWLRLALRELRGAEQAQKDHDGRAAVIAVKRAAGMALRGMLEQAPDPSYGKNYIEHVKALAHDESVPEAVRVAAERVQSANAPTQKLVILRAPASEALLLEAARDVMAHAYARIVHHEAH